MFSVIVTTDQYFNGFATGYTCNHKDHATRVIKNCKWMIRPSATKIHSEIFLLVREITWNPAIKFISIRKLTFPLGIRQSATSYIVCSKTSKCQTLEDHYLVSCRDIGNIQTTCHLWLLLLLLLLSWVKLFVTLKALTARLHFILFSSSHHSSVISFLLYVGDLHWIKHGFW